ncbi:MAG: AAA family ATPase, partial [Saprospiraceae bacterium]
FSVEKCDELTVLVCSTISEPIDGKIRFEWVKKYFNYNPKINVVHLDYNEDKLPATSESNRDISRIWADFLTNKMPDINIIFSSEPYGDFVAEYMDIEHICFDEARNTIPISATMIRENPFKYWMEMPENVRPYFAKKICLYGTESTGKSTLTKILAEYFNTNYVPEMARDIIKKTDEVVFSDLIKIAELHAQTIIEKNKKANRLLFIDTDINITRSYSSYLFQEELIVPNWIEKANKMDIYLFFSPDAPYIQDGTRLDKKERLELHESHKRELDKRGISYFMINGENWEERKNQAIGIVNDFI